MNAILALILVIPSAEPVTARVLLDKMVASRRAFNTADLRWTLETRKAPKMYRRSRYDPKNWTLEEVADPDGVVRPQQFGDPHSCSETRHLIVDGLKWVVFEHSPTAMVWDIKSDQPARPGRLPLGMPAIDARSLGIMPETKLNDLDNALPLLTEESGDEDFSVKEEGNGIIAVSVKGRRATVTWWLDKEKNYNPVKIEQRNAKGDLLSDSVIELAYYDDHIWFPKRITQTNYWREETPLVCTIEFQSAEFDRPNHPAKLTPEHIGVVPYNMVNWQGVRAMPPASRGPGCWSGTKIVTLDEVMRQQKAGTLTQASFAAWENRIRSCDGSGKGRYPNWMQAPMYGIGNLSDIDAWETYVRRFSLIRKLDDRQKASARSILDDCRKTAVPMLVKIKEAQKRESDPARKEAMLAPISNIFSNSLVPRLDGLLTMTQSQATTQPSSNQPATGSKSRPKL